MRLRDFTSKSGPYGRASRHGGGVSSGRQPSGVNHSGAGAMRRAAENVEAAVDEVLDPRPSAIIGGPGLRWPIHRQPAAYGRFGPRDPEPPWERTDRMDALLSTVSW